MTGMPKPVLAVLVVLFLSLLLCAAFTEAGTSARGRPPPAPGATPLTSGPVGAGTP